MLTHFSKMSGQKILMCHDKILLINEGEISFMENKTTKIEIRIEENKKMAFAEYAKSKGLTISALLRIYIEECIKNANKNN